MLLLFTTLVFSILFISEVNGQGVNGPFKRVIVRVINSIEKVPEYSLTRITNDGNGSQLVGTGLFSQDFFDQMVQYGYQQILAQLGFDFFGPTTFWLNSGHITLADRWRVLPGVGIAWPIFISDKEYIASDTAHKNRGKNETWLCITAGLYVIFNANGTINVPGSPLNGEKYHDIPAIGYENGCVLSGLHAFVKVGSDWTRQGNHEIMKYTTPTFFTAQKNAWGITVFYISTRGEDKDGNKFTGSSISHDYMINGTVSNGYMKRYLYHTMTFPYDTTYTNLKRGLILSQ